MSWELEYGARKITEARRPDLPPENKEKKRTWIVNIACPMEENIGEKYA